MSEAIETYRQLEARCLRFGEENRALHALAANLNAEIARLRAALEKIEKPGYGLEFNDTLREREEHWRNCAMSYRAIAREALAHPR